MNDKVKDLIERYEKQLERLKKKKRNIKEELSKDNYEDFLAIATEINLLSQIVDDLKESGKNKLEKLFIKYNKLLKSLEEDRQSLIELLLKVDYEWLVAVDREINFLSQIINDLEKIGDKK